MPVVQDISEEPVVHKVTGLQSTEKWFFCFFFLSGFCSILYELIWLRLAMARFGVTTATVSTVISCFMAGLGIGSWLGGRFLPQIAQRFRQSPTRIYAFLELSIGFSAIIFPWELSLAQTALAHLGGSLSLTSFGFYVASGLLLALAFVPWCALMGATIPLGVAALRSGHARPSKSFSLLYLANVSGAVLGALIPLLIIELRGFSGTLLVGMLLNFSVAMAALRLEKRQRPDVATGVSQSSEALIAMPFTTAMRANWLAPDLWLLFLSGLTSMGLEVVWIRIYTPFVGTVVYSFATILSVYLASTFLGSTIYRRWSTRLPFRYDEICLALWLASPLALLGADERIGIPSWLRVPCGVIAFSAALGFVTPMLVDRFSRGDARRAGLGYSINIAGCVIGPLIASFMLLPAVGEKVALLILSLPWLVFGVFSTWSNRSDAVLATRPLRAAVLLFSASVGVAVVALTQTYVDRIDESEIRRDATATVVAAGKDFGRRLYVNGVSMTVLTPITKMMASLPLVFLDRPPVKTLTICFGMGTTHRSMLAWGVDSTVVELVPSVPLLFWFFHEDGNDLLALPNSHVIIDDGRRFLERTEDQYDAIVIDPPPPVGAAGSSLLYSEEFYAAALKRLRPGGILQQWYPGGSDTTTAAVARAIKESFPFVRAFRAIDNRGIHFLASTNIIPLLPASELAARLPPVAAVDLVEWGPLDSPERQLDALLQSEIPIDALVGLDRRAPAVRDDRPVNEYYWLREHVGISK